MDNVKLLSLIYNIHKSIITLPNFITPNPFKILSHDTNSPGDTKKAKLKTTHIKPPKIYFKNIQYIKVINQVLTAILGKDNGHKQEKKTTSRWYTN